MTWYGLLIERLPFWLAIPLDRAAVRVVRPFTFLARKAGIIKPKPIRARAEVVDFKDLPDDVKAQLSRTVRDGLATAKRVKLPR